jgi:hypothetical protein
MLDPHRVPGSTEIGRRPGIAKAVSDDVDSRPVPGLRLRVEVEVLAEGQTADGLLDRL